VEESGGFYLTTPRFTPKRLPSLISHHVTLLWKGVCKAATAVSFLISLPPLCLNVCVFSWVP